MAEKHKRDFASNFAPGEGPSRSGHEPQLSQPGREPKSKVQSLKSKVGDEDLGFGPNPAARPNERKPDEGSNPENKRSHQANSKSLIGAPAVDCDRGTVAGVLGENHGATEAQRSYPDGATDLCLWEDLEIGEAFYLPFVNGIFFKTGVESYGIARGEPEWEWRLIVEGREPVWLVARAEVMQCRRCQCRKETPCDDKRLNGPCGWIAPGLCSACLNSEEFKDFLNGVYQGRQAA